MIRTLIVDDEEMAIERLRMLLGRHEDVQIAGTASNGEQALDRIDTLGLDLVLLDISMPGLGGIEVAEILQAQPVRPQVVFTTAFDRYAVRAFELRAADYLLKPVDPARLLQALERVRDLAGSPAGTASGITELWVPVRGDMRRVPVDAIIHIEAERDYMRVHTRDASYLIHATMQGLEEKLDPAAFIRTHRSHMFARDAIATLHHDGMGSWSVEDVSGARARIGRTYLKAVKAIMES